MNPADSVVHIKLVGSLVPQCNGVTSQKTQKKSKNMPCAC